MRESQPVLRHYAAVLRRQYWLIALAVGVAVGAAALLTYSQQSVYRASMKIVVGQGGGVFEPQFGNTIEPFTQTMTNLLESEIVAATVIENVGLETTPTKLLEDVHVSSRPESSVLEVAYESPDKRGAVVVLDEVGAVFTALIDEKLGRAAAAAAQDDAQTRPPITAAIFDPAHLEPEPVSPKPVRTLAFAGVLGLVLGIVLALVRESLDDRIRGERDARTWLRAPVIGTLPRDLRGTPPLGGLGSRTARPLEALNMLRADLESSQAGLAGSATLVTSALPEEGKSTVVASLATSLALAGHDVICVEADMRRPMLRRLLGVVPMNGGLVELLNGEAELEEALQEVPLVPPSGNGRPSPSLFSQLAKREVTLARPVTVTRGRLRVLFAGKPVADPALLLTSNRVDELLEKLRLQAEYVILDTPPLLLVGDAFALVRAADKVIVVAREGRTTRRDAEALRAMLDALGAENVSVVLTHAVARSERGPYAYGSTA